MEQVTPPASQAPITGQNQPSQQPVMEKNTPQDSGGNTNPTHPKANKLPFILFAVIIVLVVLGGVMLFNRNNTENKTQQGNNNILTEVSTAPTGAMTQQEDEAMKGEMEKKDTGDTQIQKDMQNIDTSIGITSTDIDGVDQGFDDKSVDLSQ